MKNLLHKLVGLLKVELEDLEKDVGDLLEICQRRKDSREITNYVYLGNQGLLINEITGIKTLIRSLDTLDTAQFHSTKEMFQEIDQLLLAKTREYACPGAVYHLVHRRLEKVINYLSG